MVESLQDITPEQRKQLEEKLKNMSPEELLEFQKKQCVFCQIIDGKVPSKKLYEDDHCIVVLDINPATRGHLLVLPKDHYAIMPQIPEKLIGHMFNVCKNLSKLLLKSLRVDGTTIFIANGLVAGQKAQHFMIHIIPRKENDAILNIEEGILDDAAVDKAKITITNKFNEMMGVKKEIVDVKKSKSVVKLEETEDVNESEGDQEEKTEVEETIKTPMKSKIKKPLETKKSKVSKKKSKNTEPQNDTKQESEESSSDVSLDDIANLFK
ncbi:MAG: HIT domain-containing protein [Candidatus Woesearchaeota archaeon]